MPNTYQLGTIEASEQLIKDLYINLRSRVNAWSEITKQTPQARMGYIGQHLVSVVTGFPGGKSGARGYDLVMDNGNFGEIKTCYRVDQLGECNDCRSKVSSLEKECAYCGSRNINRKDDSKWLIAIQHDQEFNEILDPKRYYFVLFEFEDINNIDNDTIVASIWEVNPRNKGFAFCMMDYYLNIRAHSQSKAPFNMWPYRLKFYLSIPYLIYRSFIYGDGTINTTIFPTLNNGYEDKLGPLPTYSSSKNLTFEAAEAVARKYHALPSRPSFNKKDLLNVLESKREQLSIPNHELCDSLVDAIYKPLLDPVKTHLPERLRGYYEQFHLL